MSENTDKLNHGPEYAAPKTRDGGPAFPVTPSEQSRGWPGLSLRDWFAGQSLAGLRAHYGLLETQAGVVKDAFCDADAMLREREKRT